MNGKTSFSCFLESKEMFVPLVGEAIREYLLREGEGYPYGFYREYKTVKPTTSYDSIRRYFYILKQLGLIELVRTEPSRGQFPRHMYRIVPGMERDPRFGAPQVELYPQTKWGKRRYRRRKELGLPIHKGRREEYR